MIKMSAPMDIFSANNVLIEINGFVQQSLQKEGANVKAIKFGKRSNDFSKGDIFLAQGCASAQEQVLTKVRERLIEELGRELFFRSVTSDKFNSIVIFLKREIYYKHVLSRVQTQNDSYGKLVKLPPFEKQVVVCNHNLRVRIQRHRNAKACDDDRENSCDVTLDCLRSVVLAEHLTLLLQTNGYKVTNLVSESSWQSVIDICNELGIDKDSIVKVDAGTKEEVGSRLRSLQDHRTVTKRRRTKRLDRDPDQNTDDSIPQTCDVLEFDAKNFITEQRLQEGRNCFDKNLNTITLAEDSGASEVLKEALMIHNCLQEKNPPQIIHIAEQSLSFTSQKIDLVLKLLSDTQTGNQFHFVHGKVTKSKGCQPTEEFHTKSYLKLRYQQMKEAAIMKYGDSVKGEGWEQTLKCLTTACVKFELLSNTARNTVKLKLDAGEEGSVENSLQGSFVMYNCARLATLFIHFDDAVKLKLDAGEEGSVENSLQGSFVMYNCARLATLFIHFDDAVRNGSYPALPPIETIDFTLLREEEEWGLLFNYIYPYPDLVRETVTNIETNKSMFVSLQTHKICQMLIGLSRAVSSYYSRYHVLGEARPHLLPTMFARLHLLKAVHQVVINSLRLIGNTPLTQL